MLLEVMCITIFLGLGGENASGQRFMLACRHWRDVAVATPALWHTIDVGTTSSNWMQLALICPGDATIDSSFPFGFNEEVASLFQPHGRLLGLLRLRSWSLSALPIVSDPLPALETWRSMATVMAFRMGRQT